MSKNMSTKKNTKNMVRKRPPKRHPGEAPKRGSKMDPEGDPKGTFSRDRCVACLERSRQLVAQSIMRRTSTGLGPMAMPMFTQSHRPEMIFGSSPPTQQGEHAVWTQSSNRLTVTPIGHKSGLQRCVAVGCPTPGPVPFRFLKAQTG